MSRHYRIRRAPAATSIEVMSCDDDSDWILEATFDGPDQDEKAEAYLECVAGIPLDLFDQGGG